MTSNAHQSRWTIPSQVSSASIFGYNSDGWKFGNASSYSRIINQTSLTFPFSVEFKVTELSNFAIIQYIYSNGTTPNAYVSYNDQYHSININGTDISKTVNVGDTLRIDWKTSKVEVYLNNIKVGENSHTVTSPTNVEFHTSSNRYCRIKDFKIKPL